MRRPGATDSLIVGIVGILAGLSLHLVMGCVEDRTTPKGAGPPADVGVYGGDGTLDASVRASFAAVADAGFSSDTLTLADIVAGGLDRFRVVLIPGGDAHTYSTDFGPVGRSQLRQWVSSGGGYIGFGGGGAVAASDSGNWPGIGLVSGSALWPLSQIAPYPHLAMTEVVAPEHRGPVARRIRYQTLYYGGPEFRPTDPSRIFADYNYQLTGTPAALTAEYGFGRIWVAGFQPEIEEGSPRDSTDFGDDFQDPDSEWELIKAALEHCIGP